MLRDLLHLWQDCRCNSSSVLKQAHLELIGIYNGVGPVKEPSGQPGRSAGV